MNNNHPLPAVRVRRPVAWPAVCTALAIAAATALVTRPPPADAQQPAAAQPNPVGRYRVEVVSRPLDPVMVLVDTQTGHTWTANATGGAWADRGTPPTDTAPHVRP